MSAVAPTRAERDEQRRIVSSGAYDQRYHLRCDTVANINYTALDQMSDAAAHTAPTLAKRDFRRNSVRTRRVGAGCVGATVPAL